MENETVQFKTGYIDASKIKTWDIQCEGKICSNCGKIFPVDVAANNLNEDFDKLCPDCQAKSCSLFFGLFSDFKGE